MIDEPNSLLGQVILIDGTVKSDATVITGERTLTAHYVENGWTVPSTVQIRLTLTPR